MNGTGRAGRVPFTDCEGEPLDLVFHLSSVLDFVAAMTVGALAVYTGRCVRQAGGVKRQGLGLSAPEILWSAVALGVVALVSVVAALAHA